MKCGIAAVLVMATALSGCSYLPWKKTAHVVAPAKNEEAARQCGWVDKPDPEVIIAGCTAIITDYTDGKESRARAYNNRGKAYLLKREPDKALADENEAIRLLPDSAPGYINRGNAYFASSQTEKSFYDSSISDYTTAIRLDPALPDSYSSRGLAYLAKDRLDDAIADFSAALQLQADNPHVFFMRAMAYGKKEQYDKAIADYDQVIRLAPDRAEAYYNRGVIKQEMNDNEGGASDIKTAKTMGFQ